MTVFVLDAGAQIAIDRNDRGVSAMLRVVLDDGDEVQVIGERPGGCLRRTGRRSRPRRPATRRGRHVQARYDARYPGAVAMAAGATPQWTTGGEQEMARDQVSTNYNVYVAKYQDDLERDHAGKVALLHDGRLIEVHERYVDAYWHGFDDYGLGNFSIQEIGSEPAQLGSLTFALQ